MPKAALGWLHFLPYKLEPCTSRHRRSLGEMYNLDHPLLSRGSGPCCHIKMCSSRLAPGRWTDGAFLVRYAATPAWPILQVISPLSAWSLHEAERACVGNERRPAILISDLLSWVCFPFFDLFGQRSSSSSAACTKLARSFRWSSCTQLG